MNVNATVSDTGAPEPDTGAPEDAALDAGFPATNLASTPIDFGLVGCGAVPAAKTLTFTNTGTAPLTYSIALASGTYFALQGATSGTVAPGAEASVSLAPPALPITSNAGSPITDTLNVTTNIPGFTSFSVPVSVTPQGGSLLVSPAPVAFGQVLVGDAFDAPVTITNVGNAPVGITVGAPANGDFGFAYTGGDAGLEGGVSVAPDASLPGATAAFKPTVGVLELTNAAITTTGAMCASAASQVAMNGTGTFAAVTVAPGTLPFGTTTCGSPAAPFQTVTITNAYDYVVPYTSALAVGTAYTLTNASGNVPAGGHATITVTPKAIAAPASVAPGAFDDTLTVTPTAPGTTATPVALTRVRVGRDPRHLDGDHELRERPGEPDRHTPVHRDELGEPERSPHARHDRQRLRRLVHDGRIRRGERGHREGERDVLAGGPRRHLGDPEGDHDLGAVRDAPCRGRPHGQRAGTGRRGSFGDGGFRRDVRRRGRGVPERDHLEHDRDRGAHLLEREVDQGPVHDCRRARVDRRRDQRLDRDCGEGGGDRIDARGAGLRGHADLLDERARDAVVYGQRLGRRERREPRVR